MFSTWELLILDKKNFFQILIFSWTDNLLKLDVLSAIYVTWLKKLYKFFFNNFPFQYIAPEEGSIRLSNAFNNVVFPEPFLPFSKIILPDPRDD